jgi:hypothetical protein
MITIETKATCDKCSKTCNITLKLKELSASLNVGHRLEIESHPEGWYIMPDYTKCDSCMSNNGGWQDL